MSLFAPQDFVQQNTLIEEMLHLIIMVIGESWATGIHEKKSDFDFPQSSNI